MVFDWTYALLFVGSSKFWSCVSSVPRGPEALSSRLATAFGSLVNAVVSCVVSSWRRVVVPTAAPTAPVLTPMAPIEFVEPLPKVWKTVARRLRNIVSAVGSSPSGPADPAVPPDCPGVFWVSWSSVLPRLLKLVMNVFRAVCTPDVSTPTLRVSDVSSIGRLADQAEGHAVDGVRDGVAGARDRLAVDRELSRLTDLLRVRGAGRQLERSPQVSARVGDVDRDRAGVLLREHDLVVGAVDRGDHPGGGVVDPADDRRQGILRCVVRDRHAVDRQDARGRRRQAGDARRNRGSSPCA